MLSRTVAGHHARMIAHALRIRLALGMGFDVDDVANAPESTEPSATATIPYPRYRIPCLGTPRFEAKRLQGDYTETYV